ncbi:hypothetical protein IFM89_010245 [Coptis chinensis]|uniref:WD repeat-containing protein 6 n=1 Tax=Coptis chinensis TaxID=261450 RepID=A0A835IMI9_9MAGN|nr:hypothetical protein IFM89_010245 [Coptis chinensis]
MLETTVRAAAAGGMASEEESPHSTTKSLHSGAYLGEVSALCFIHHLSSFPLLLVGSGPHILVYDVESGKQLNSFNVFQGIRVHGISCTTLSSSLTSTVAVFGEKIVKLFTLSLQTPLVCAELVLKYKLPRFRHWVMDVLFLKEECTPVYLAVGLGENSVCFWDIARSTMVTEVIFPERTLLYSMRLWGENISSFLVASGTIYNEVIVWKLVSQGPISPPTGSLEKLKNCRGFPYNKNQLCDQHHEAFCVSRHAGHEGSIFRLAWSPDGSQLMSVSDDRSARVWKIGAVTETTANPRFLDASDSNGLILFGHSARIWDCYISETLIVTAGEDCTCRVWGMDGKQLMLIKDHSGRGIWRCTYDPSSSLLITAGFDSSVKVHQMHDSLRRGSVKQNIVAVDGFKERMEHFKLSVPNMQDQLQLLHSKSEYVRCLHFTWKDSLYVATNNGYLHHVNLSDAANPIWTELVHVSEDMPIVCMDSLSRIVSDPSTVIEDWVAVGDGKGNVTVVRVVADVCRAKVDCAFTCYIFTADPRGILKLWNFCRPLHSGCDEAMGSFKALLTAEFTSCFGTRIMCLDASFDAQVLICGDQRGNLIMFTLSRGLLTTSIASEIKISPINIFKGAHGISSVTSILVSPITSNQVEVRSTGGDGCVCYFRYDGDWRSLEFTGMKQVKELSLIQSVTSDVNSDEDLACGSYAVGFTSAKFMVWSLLNEIKIVQISCGGWRRPHSSFLGDVPEYQNCFAFVKDHVINILRLWIPSSERKLIPHVLCMQYHGREIHSLCFVSDALQSFSDENIRLGNRFGCIATGCEDGTVRLTRYAPENQNWVASKLLGEHVGGSAVRSICYVSKIHKIAVDGTCMFNGHHRCNVLLDQSEYPSLLISIGSKRVLTTWLRQKKRLSNNRVLYAGGDVVKPENSFDQSQGAQTSISFHWLSTDMPSKFSSAHKTTEISEKFINQGTNVTNVHTGPSSEIPATGSVQLDPNVSSMDKNENDWRYLAVTAFLVKGSDCRSVVCFIVVSCSDAALTLRALILPYRLWFDVALLVPQTAPVLSLQNVILQTCAPSQDNLPIGCVYIVISGSTDGSVTFWDLTETVEGFMQRMSEIQPENLIDSQIRPRTGRGSQGGRWWRTLCNRFSKTNTNGIMGTIDAENTSNGHKIIPTDCGATLNLESDLMHSEVTSAQPMNTANLSCSEELLDDSPNKVSEVRPFHVLNNVHQSGVNCLHVSTIRGCENPEFVSSYCVLSGGDDQALHCLIFDLSQQVMDDGFQSENPSDNSSHSTDMRNVTKLSLNEENQRCRIRFLSHERISSAHSSAVKGVWTDGTWAFTIGLDQRVRCWHHKEHGKLSEHEHLILSVTEPETLDARACGRNQYQIVVAGRGMQMVNFSPSTDKDGCG